jgi:Cu/Ag efflux protein CusF
MTRRLALVLATTLLASAPAHAQLSGGGGGGGGGRHGGGNSNAPSSTSAKPSKPSKLPADLGDSPTSKIEIVGVIQGIDRATGRVTISYEPVDELNWPHGTMPFPVAEDSLLDGASVGEKVRFKLDSHEIYEMKPY